jgi:hypothetical protein
MRTAGSLAKQLEYGNEPDRAAELLRMGVADARLAIEPLIPEHQRSRGGQPVSLGGYTARTAAELILLVAEADVQRLFPAPLDANQQKAFDESIDKANKAIGQNPAESLDQPAVQVDALSLSPWLLTRYPGVTADQIEELRVQTLEDAIRTVFDRDHAPSNKSVDGGGGLGEPGPSTTTSEDEQQVAPSEGDAAKESTQGTGGSTLPGPYDTTGEFFAHLRSCRDMKDAAIRDYWQRLDDDARRIICPTDSALLATKGGKGEKRRLADNVRRRTQGAETKLTPAQ